MTDPPPPLGWWYWLHIPHWLMVLADSPLSLAAGIDQVPTISWWYQLIPFIGSGNWLIFLIGWWYWLTPLIGCGYLSNSTSLAARINHLTPPPPWIQVSITFHFTGCRYQSLSLSLAVGINHFLPHWLMIVTDPPHRLMVFPDLSLFGWLSLLLWPSV